MAKIEEGRLMLTRILVVILFLFTHTIQAEESAPKHYKVIIIGAGIAGLEAAHYLQEHGIENYIILEARDRIGGRANTITPWSNVRLELGAGYIHGGDSKNPLMKLVQKWHLDTVSVNYDEKSFYDLNGYTLSNTTESYYDKLYADFLKIILQKRASKAKYSNLSVSDVVVELINSLHLNKEAQRGLIYEICDRIEQEYAADIRDLSALWYDNEDEFSGEDKLLTHGYQDIVNGLAKDLKSPILLNQIVTNVNYHNKRSIVVSTAKGKQFKGEFVISTLPLGVLKSGKVTFVPALPQEKIDAMKHLNMGVMNKVYMLFPKVFWSSKQFFGYIAPAYWSGTHWVNKDRWIEFDNLDYFFHQPILGAIVAGDFAKELESKTDNEIIHSVMQTLRIIYGDKIPEPTAYIITRWGKDPFSFGSYSSLRPGALDDGEDYLNLAKPVSGHLLFAGEATTDLYPSTVYGAYLSGDRVAKELLIRQFE
jgi:monoamine oxidase